MAKITICFLQGSSISFVAQQSEANRLAAAVEARFDPDAPASVRIRAEKKEASTYMVIDPRAVCAISVEEGADDIAEAAASMRKSNVEPVFTS